MVDILKSGYSKEAHLMHMIRVLVFQASYFQFWFTAVHIEGKKNIWADAISRNDMNTFISQASHSPATVPPMLVEILSQIITWTSTDWMTLFTSIICRL